MMFLLDTNVISELRKIRTATADPRVRSWSQQLDSESGFLSVITLLELEVGILQMERRDKRQGAMLRTWLDEWVFPVFEGRILDVDRAIVMRCASLHVPNPMEYRDSLIAATALVHGLVLVTRNVSHFERAGVEILNPWAR